MMHTIVPLNNESKPILTKVYKESFFLASERKCFNGNNEVIDWGLDLRYSLSKSRFLVPLTEEIIKILDKERITQIAGRGFGSFFLIGSIAAKKPNIRAAFIRDSPKPYGYRQIIEGDLRRNQRTLIIDDVIVSGGSMGHTISILRKEKIKIYGGLAVFRFGWKQLTGLPEEFKLISVAMLHYKKAYHRIYVPTET